MFPATLVVSPSTGLLYVVNFNLHGDIEPSSISVVEAETMIEVAQIPTGIMPHGARLDAKGARREEPSNVELAAALAPYFLPRPSIASRNVWAREPKLSLCALS